MSNEDRGAYLKRLREAARLSLEDVGDIYGVSRQQILNYENCKTPVGQDRFIELVTLINEAFKQANVRYAQVLEGLQVGEIAEPAGAAG